MCSVGADFNSRARCENVTDVSCTAGMCVCFLSVRRSERHNSLCSLIDPAKWGFLLLLLLFTEACNHHAKAALTCLLCVCFSAASLSYTTAMNIHVACRGGWENDEQLGTLLDFVTLQSC